jgi:hypothetical protein
VKLAAGLLIGAALSSVFTYPAAAQRETAAAPSKQAVTAMHNFSRCVVDRGNKGAAEVLAMDYRTMEYGDALRKLALGFDHCAPGAELRFNGLLFAGGLAERMLVQARGARSLADLLAYDASKPPVQARDEGEMTALCTARKAPQQLQLLLETDPASKEEASAIKSLQPVIASCLGKGQQMRLNAPGLRSLLALGAYRLMQHNRSQSSES